MTVAATAAAAVVTSVVVWEAVTVMVALEAVAVAIVMVACVAVAEVVAVVVVAVELAAVPLLLSLPMASNQATCITTLVLEVLKQLLLPLLLRELATTNPLQVMPLTRHNLVMANTTLATNLPPPVPLLLAELPPTKASTTSTLNSMLNTNRPMASKLLTVNLPLMALNLLLDMVSSLPLTVNSLPRVDTLPATANNRNSTANSATTKQPYPP
jgi:hypothetical protein